MEDCFPEKCAACQEEYDFGLPRNQLNVVRTKECPLHFVHRECALPWFRRHRNCAVCLEPSDEIVDFEGKVIVSVTSPGGAPGGGQPEQVRSLECLEIYGPDAFFSIPKNEQLDITLDFLKRSAPQFSEQSVCSLCGKSIPETNRAVVIPCKHEFHHSCFFGDRPIPNWFVKICPNASCSEWFVVVGDPLRKRSFFDCNPELLALALYAEQVPAQTQGSNASVCQLCDDNAAGEERVITPCCHVFHRSCYDAHAGSDVDAVPKCPKTGCGKPCVSVTPLPRQAE